MDLLRVRSSRSYLVAAGVAAALSALIAFAYLRGVTVRAAQAGRLVELVVAARDLRSGETLDPSSLQLVPFPDRYLLPGTFTDPSPLSGQRLARGVRQGEPILESALLSAGGEELSEVLTPGFRAFPLPQETAGFPFHAILPGSRVDLVFVEGEAARLGLEDVKVIGSAAAAGSSLDLSSDPADQPCGCLLLEVTPDEACLLASALKAGRVEVLLRKD